MMDYYRQFQSEQPFTPDVDDVKKTFLDLLSQPTIASKEWVYDQYDYMVRTNTVVPPGSDAAVLRIRGTRKALVMTTDCNSRYIYLDPETGGKIAVAEAARNIVCSGGIPLAVTDCLNFGSPEKPEIFWQLEKAVDGMSEACRKLETPVIGGNVSLYNETNGTAVFPTPVVGMVGLIEDLNHITTQAFQTEGDLIYLLGTTKAEFGGSELQKLVKGDYSGKAPEIDLDTERNLQRQLLEAIRSGYVASAHDLSEGGLAVALAESVLSGKKGAKVRISGEPVVDLFSESQSRFLVSVKWEHQTAFERIVDATLIGEVRGKDLIVENRSGMVVLYATQDEMESAWKGAIPCLLKSRV